MKSNSVVADNKPVKPTKPPNHTQAVILHTKQAHPNLTTRQIGKLAGTSHVYVIDTLKRYNISGEHVDRYKLHRADILAGLQDKLLTSITKGDIKKAPMRDKVVSMGILYDKERLERDLTTANVATINADLESIRALRSASADKAADMSNTEADN